MSRTRRTTGHHGQGISAVLPAMATITYLGRDPGKEWLQWGS